MGRPRSAPSALLRATAASSLLAAAASSRQPQLAFAPSRGRPSASVTSLSNFMPNKANWGGGDGGGGGGATSGGYLSGLSGNDVAAAFASAGAELAAAAGSSGAAVLPSYLSDLGGGQLGEGVGRLVGAA
eukprot:CAMPEP_0183313292 /NCGR_PEP_ID=MMETSP0160_2-20130417/44794_1 /TAXON_ID=2839 ORGANISM="Odontella Sinensis, Strain Grunow 1884" /NCGR_SAMPLE_ID=MMETSP0160_2 /ASSEMBLY_ACC=CAM_ASM_000250 /LENGTH=129 /DNA_ID=CAMNT_0025478343 /DNA_START=88 /DNA_END=473 /DNA_ORIENTATION=+